MKIQSKNNSSSSKRYVVQFETDKERQLTNNELYDAIAPYNFGGMVYSRTDTFADLLVYID